ncbi:cyclic AMP-dependent transcription factor ATF-7 isoform X2 [Drosophila hydei]|uniref:Cyclic AMP-dependent transcription factor ATF-7 isoform X2 n=1 Tax=Drosophila hydei TaxID=7224 RepID=A0A6J1LEA1_DROHY|nr:cyclic AMP-dependent transcription factor ATF-7 isoform X2 [Drosophila hydei]
METDANIADMTDVSFAAFETKTNDGNENFDSYGQCQSKHDMTLDLSLGQKSEQLFATDQTPTPTRLIKNCEEVGLFDDLQHVNPFDIGFQRAAEQNAVAGKAPETPIRTEAPATDGDSLHTPQVYPLEATTMTAANQTARQNSSPLDVPVAHVEELLATPAVGPDPAEAQGPPPLQLIQPPVITWVLPAQTLPITTIPDTISKPVPSKQTVRPFILPKPSIAGHNKVTTGIITHNTMPVNEPSSASLTPTSQLPIKERLKAILNNSNNSNRKQRSFTSPPRAKATIKRNEDCMERRRAAASRYRDKMRNAHKDLKEHNAQLLQQIRKLNERVAALERELQQCHNNNNNTNVTGNHLQIPPSSIHLIINVPKMLVPGQTLDQKFLNMQLGSAWSKVGLQSQ